MDAVYCLYFTEIFHFQLWTYSDIISRTVNILFFYVSFLSDCQFAQHKPNKINGYIKCSFCWNKNIMLLMCNDILMHFMIFLWVCHSPVIVVTLFGKFWQVKSSFHRNLHHLKVTVTFYRTILTFICAILRLYLTTQTSFPQNSQNC